MTTPQLTDTSDQADDATGYGATPNAEKYVLAADALRRRQLASALIHGSDRTWRERRRIWPAATGGVIAVVIVVMVVAAVGAFHRQQEITREKERQRAASEVAGFPVMPFKGDGFTVNVPADWTKRATKHKTTFTDRKQGRWLSVAAVDDRRGARAIVQAKDRQLSRGCCNLRYYKWLGLRSAKLGKYKGAELEYTGVNRKGERRHLVLRVVSVKGTSYQITMSVPEKGMEQSKPILDEAARSFTLSR